ncbi:hypothetical protein JCM3765_000893 [Sporobolomyces pararoseus]
MSTRSTRKKGRISYKEDTPDESDAVESSQEEEDDEDEFTLSKKKKKQPTQKKGKGKRGKQESQSDSDSTSDGEEDSDTGSDGQGDDEEDTKAGVDFSRKVPYEIVAEIFSYLTPRELLTFNNSSKSFHSILSGPSSRTLWAKSRKNLGIPAVELDNVTEQQLATLLFDKRCESCNVGKVERPDLYLCKRFCPACREANWVKVNDIEKLYPDFHAAVSQAVPTTNFSAKNDSWRISTAFAAYDDLRNVNEHLEHLELLDAANQPLTDEEEDDEGDSEEGSASTSSGSRTRAGGRSTRTRINYAVDADSSKETSKKLKRANRLKHSWRPYRKQLGAQLEAQINQSFSPRVQEFLKKQKEHFEEWQILASKLTDSLSSIEAILKTEAAESEVALRKAVQLRRSSIESKLRKKGFKRWSFNDSIWINNDLVRSSRLLTDEEWMKIKKRLKKLAGQGIANQLWREALADARRVVEKKKQSEVLEAAKKKLARLQAVKDVGDDEEEDDELDSDEEGEEEEQQMSEAWKAKVLKKPKKLSTKVWKYVRPHLEDLASSQVDREDSPSSSTSFTPQITKEDNALRLLSYDQAQAKLNFFSDKYQKIVDLQPSSDQQFALPLFSRFLHLPSVKELYYSNPFYGAQSKVKAEKEKADKVWEKKLEEILEECEQYGVDTLAHVVETVLSTTTNIDPKKLSRLDITHLLSDAELEKPNALIDGNFFSRPSSFVICGICRYALGPVDSIHEHQHEKHTSRYATLSSSPSRSELFPLELSIEASCAVSAVFEVADVKMDNRFAMQEVKAALEGKILLWDNQPKGLGKKSTKAEDWKELVCKIHRTALEEERQGRVLAAPILVLRNKSAREIRRERWGRGLYGRW